jgi:ribonuclease HII
MKSLDNSFITDKIKLIAGIDEAGRGPLAGPVVVAAVIFPEKTRIYGVNDSKLLTEEEREKLFPRILQKALCFSVSVISHGTIDRINILQASLLGMKTAAKRLNVQPDLILVDGNKIFNYDIPVIPLIKGDSRSFAIAAASIIAKVTRDRLMKRLCPIYPHYLWSKNKGYATQEHIHAIKTYGSCCLHRKTFLNRILNNEPVPELELAFQEEEEIII